MKKSHKISSVLILMATIIIAFFSKAQMTDATAQNLVTFFSIVFGFYITSIAILYSASYTKILHKHIDENTQKRGTHTLKSYLNVAGYWSIFSITSIIIFTIFATKNSSGALNTNIDAFIMPFLKAEINPNLLLSSCLFAFSILNIFYLLLLMNTIIDGMIEEAKK